jgi:hypothetical protein
MKKLLVLVIILFVSKSIAFTPIFVPEWSIKLNSLPKDVILYDIEGDRLAEIAVALEPNRVILLSNTGDSILWVYQTQTEIDLLAVLKTNRPNPILIVTTTPHILALDNKGKILWQIRIDRFTNKSINWIKARNIDQNLDDELIVVAENLLFIITSTGRIINKFLMSISPTQIKIGNIDDDLNEEIVVSDYSKILAYKIDGSIIFEKDIIQHDNQINQGFDLYDFTLDRINEILVITHSEINYKESEREDLVTCFLSNGEILWQSREKIGIPRILKIAKGEIYTIGTTQLGQDYISKRDRNGKILKTVYFSNDNPLSILYNEEAKTNQNPIQLQELYLIGNYLLTGLGWSTDLSAIIITSFRLFSTDLEEIKLMSPDYFSDARIVLSNRNQTLNNLLIGSLNGDTLPDILLARDRGEKGYVIDCLVNHIDVLSRAEIELWDGYRRALGTGNRLSATRLKRQAKIISSNLGNTIAALRTEKLIHRQWRNRLEVTLVRSILIIFFIISILFFLSVIVLKPIVKKRIHRYAQVESKSVPTVVKIANEIIALDHNYIVKGNFNGAYNRLNEIIYKYRLQMDQDFGLLLRKSISKESLAEEGRRNNFQTSYYRFINRLIQDSRTTNFISIIKKICNNVLGQSIPITELSLNRNEYVPEKYWERNQLGKNSLSVSFIYLVNRDFPDIYNNSNLFWDQRLYNWFEHICSDHLRYAKHYAQFVFDYETATEWSRKVVLHLVSDSDKKIDYKRKNSHLLSEFDEVKTEYQDYILMSDDERSLYYSGEKIWVKIIDLISIISTIISHKKIL